MPDFMKMTSTGKSGRKQDTMNKPFDNDFLKDPFSESMTSFSPPRLTYDLVNTLSSMGDTIQIKRQKLLSEIDEKQGDPNGEA